MEQNWIHDDVVKWKHFDVFFDLCQNKRLSRQSRRRWFDVTVMFHVYMYPRGSVLLIKSCSNPFQLTRVFKLIIWLVALSANQKPVSKSHVQYQWFNVFLCNIGTGNRRCLLNIGNISLSHIFFDQSNIHVIFSWNQYAHFRKIHEGTALTLLNITHYWIVI